jgi:hypothetical protein
MATMTGKMRATREVGLLGEYGRDTVPMSVTCFVFDNASPTSPRIVAYSRFRRQCAATERFGNCLSNDQGSTKKAVLYALVCVSEKTTKVFSWVDEGCSTRVAKEERDDGLWARNAGWCVSKHKNRARLQKRAKDG